MISKSRNRWTHLGLGLAMAMVGTLACSTVMRALPGDGSEQPGPTDAGQHEAATESVAEPSPPSPTPEAMGPLPAGYEQTGRVDAVIGGEPYTWYTFRPPAATGATTNSAGWSLRAGALGTYKGVVAIAGAFEGDTPEPSSGIYLEFPFKDEGAPFELDVPADPLEPAVEIRVNLGDIDYQMVDGMLNLEQVDIEGDTRAFHGTFEGTLAPVDAGGSPEDSATITLVGGTFGLKQVESVSEMPADQNGGS